MFQYDIHGKSGLWLREFWKPLTTDEETKAFAERVVAGVQEKKKDLDAIRLKYAEELRRFVELSKRPPSRP